MTAVPEINVATATQNPVATIFSTDNDFPIRALNGHWMRRGMFPRRKPHAHPERNDQHKDETQSVARQGSTGRCAECLSIDDVFA